jgi:hypothetical protein
MCRVLNCYVAKQTETIRDYHTLNCLLSRKYRVYRKRALQLGKLIQINLEDMNRVLNCYHVAKQTEFLTWDSYGSMELLLLTECFEKYLYRMFQNELYNFDRLCKFIQRITTVF